MGCSCQTLCEGTSSALMLTQMRPPNEVYLVPNQEQQPQGLRKANQDKTDNYCLDRRYVIPQAEFSGPFRDQNVKTPEPKSDHRDAAESDHIGED